MCTTLVSMGPEYIDVSPPVYKTGLHLVSIYGFESISVQH